MTPARLLAVMAAFQAFNASAETTAFVNVNVIPMSSERVLPGQSVIVVDGIIASIGKVQETVLPDNAVIVDGTDRFLMPGLAEMHGHVPGASSDSLDRVMSLYSVNGVTTVRGMLGQSSHLTLREHILAGDVTGPRLITSGPSLNGNSVSGPDDAERRVREQHSAGYDFLKIHPGLTLVEFSAIAETANDLNMPFAGHVPEDVGVRNALLAGIATIDHLDGYMESLVIPHDDPSGGFGGFFGLFLANHVDESLIGEIVSATRAAGVWNVPTQTLFEHVTSPENPDEMRNWPEMKYMPRATVERWVSYKNDLRNDASYDPNVAEKAISIRRKLIAELHEAGAGLLLGSDSPQIFNVPGFAIHRELKLLVASGLSPYEALRTGTVSPARYFGEAESIGTVDVGKVADLILLDANPLIDIDNSRRVHGVMLRGHWISQQDIASTLARLEQAAQN